MGDEERKRESDVRLTGDAGGAGLDDAAPAPVGQPAQERLVPGARLGPYELFAAIGSGGMGEVFRAFDPRLGRHVAIKVLPERLFDDRQAQARLEREAKAVAALSHPNILAIFDVGNDHGVAYVVTELLEGESLGSRVKRGPIPWREAVDIGVAIADALTAAHSKGFIHRDLKPDNVFLTSDHRVKLLDFGIARWKPDALGQPDVSLRTETIEGTVIGTVGYMSPEQVRGDPADTTSDIFSFGCVLHEMLTGKRAFRGASPIETMVLILNEQPIPPGILQVGLPPDLDRIVASCLEKLPEARFQDARVLMAALRSVEDVSTPSGISIALPPAPPDRTIDSIAVLPFANTSDDPEMEFLTDGITECLINSLSQLGNVRVVARSTVFKYKGRQIDPEAAGRALHVRSVLTGRVVQRGESLNVQSELVDVIEGSQIWGDQYNHKLRDIFVVQEVIAREISKTLRLKLSHQQKKRLTRRYTDNSEAYQLYLRGRYYWNKRTPEWMTKGIESFRMAIAKDPGYALAYAGLADCYVLLGSYGALSPRDAFLEARNSALKALEIDKSLAEAHTSLAFARGFYEWDWRAAQRGFERAIELSPSYPTAHHWYAYLLMALGRLDEAIPVIHKALELDPLSLVINAQLAWALHFARRYDDAIDHARKTLEMEPGFGIAQLWLGLSHLHSGAYDNAVASLRSARKALGNAAIVSGALGYAYAVAGRSEEAGQTMEQLIADSPKRYITPVAIALIWLGLGDMDQAFQWLEKGLGDRSWWLAWLKVDPLFDRARSDPRFESLLAQVGV